MTTDQEAIKNLCSNYTFRLDEGDFKGVAKLLKNSELRMLMDGFNDKTVSGEKNVESFYADQVMTYDGEPCTRHVITNQAVDVDESGESATSRCYWTLYQSPPGELLAMLGMGQYHDRFTKTKGSWSFADKTIQVDFLNDNSEHFKVAPDFEPA